MFETGAWRPGYNVLDTQAAPSVVRAQHTWLAGVVVTLLTIHL